MERKKKILFSIGFALTVALVIWGYNHFTWISTDDAYVQAHTVMISARVAGTVQTVGVSENQKVKAGDLIAQLDPRDIENALKQMSAQLASQQAQLNDAEVSFKRISGLYQRHAVSQQQFDDSQARYRTALQTFNGLSAQVDQAKLNLSYTKIVAPSDGVISKKAVEPGMYVSVGQPLIGFVDLGERWVMANYKETELERIQPGRRAVVDVDAIGGKTFEGTLDSISGSTGAQFALLPPDNATGNFTKVVQRVPVRIKLTNLSAEDIEKLRAGLSANVSVRVR